MKLECDQKQNLYKVAVKKANEFKENHYIPSLTDLTQRLVQHEEERIDLFKAVVDRLIVYETNKELNNQYDVKAFAGVAANIDAEQHVKFFRSKIGLMQIENIPDFNFVKVAMYDPNPMGGGSRA